MPIKLAFAADDGTDLLRTGLVAYWPLEEGSGSRLDAGITGEHLTQDGGSPVGTATGKVGANAAAMVAAQNHNLQRVALDLSTGSWFIAGWFKLTNKGGDVWLVSRDDANADRGHWLRFDQSEDTIVAGISTTGNDAVEVSARAPGLNQWSLMIYGWDADFQSVLITVDVSDLASEAAGADWNSDSAVDFMVGGRVPSSPQDNADLHVDHLGVWDVNLTDSHIVALYAGGDGVAVYGGR